MYFTSILNRRTMEPLYVLIVLIIINTIQCTETDKTTDLPLLYKCCAPNQIVGIRGMDKKVCMDPPKPIDFSKIPLVNYEVGKTIYDIYNVIPNKFKIDSAFHINAMNTMALSKFNIYLTEDIRNNKVVLHLLAKTELLGLYRGNEKVQSHSRMGTTFSNEEYEEEGRVQNIAIELHQPINLANLSPHPHYIKKAVYLEMPNAYNRFIKIDEQKVCVDFYRGRNNVTQPSFWIPRVKDEPEGNDDLQTVALFISSFFLLLVLVVYALLPELRNMCGLILMAYVASLLSAFLCLGIIRMQQHSLDVCFNLTLAIYFFFLASFCWMNVMSYDIWWTFRGYAKARPIHRRGKPFKYLMYSIYAWGVPIAMTIMLAWIHAQPMTDKPWFIKPNLRCFIEGGEKLLYLYIPMLILICTNWMFYLMTAFNIWRLSRGTSVLDSAAAGTPAAHRSNRQRFLLYLKLSIVMGLNWILEVISFLVPGFRVWYISDAYNILVGIAIFLIFVCKRKILRKLTKLFIEQTHRTKWYSSNSSRGNTTTSETSQETQSLNVCVNPKGPGYVINNF